MFDLAEYGSMVYSMLADAVEHSQLMPLAPHQAVDSPALTTIRETPAADLFDGDTPASDDFAQCVRSALLLYYSALDESHTISQGISSSTGGYLHGIMHRQEPDYPNSKYWFRRIGRHELFPTLLAEAQQLRIVTSNIERELAPMSEWDPVWFIDHCEKAVSSGGPGGVTADLVAIQNLEWRLVFDYSYRRALSG
jgi:hypothetical protein